MLVFYAAFFGHVFGRAFCDIQVNCVTDRKKEQITAPSRGQKTKLFCKIGQNT